MLRRRIGSEASSDIGLGSCAEARTRVLWVVPFRALQVSLAHPHPHPKVLGGSPQKEASWMGSHMVPAGALQGYCVCISTSPSSSLLRLTPGCRAKSKPRPSVGESGLGPAVQSDEQFLLQCFQLASGAIAPKGITKTKELRLGHHREFTAV